MNSFFSKIQKKIGASPIMSTNRVEVEELAAVNGAMLLNMGTLNDIDTMIYAAQANGRHGNPVILDPVGGGATTFRKQTVQRFINEANLTIIKGNGAEILSLANRGGRSRGVDSVGGVDRENAKNAVKELAQKYSKFLLLIFIDKTKQNKTAYTKKKKKQLKSN